MTDFLSPSELSNEPTNEEKERVTSQVNKALLEMAKNDWLVTSVDVSGFRQYARKWAIERLRAVGWEVTHERSYQGEFLNIRRKL